MLAENDLFRSLAGDRGRLGSRSIFEAMSKEDLIKTAKQYQSRSAFLRALGFQKRDCLGLSKRMVQEGLNLTDLWPNSQSKINREGAEQHHLDLTDPNHAYFYGLSLADGSLMSGDRNRGRLGIEMRGSDGDVLEALHTILPWKGNLSQRLRNSPFDGKPVRTVILNYHGFDLRKQMIERGFPVGAKSRVCDVPNGDFDRRSFWRGFIDGDGSLGITGQGLPFLSLVTISDAIAASWGHFVGEVCGFTPSVNKNKRDSAYNIMITRSRAVVMASTLYQEGDVCLERKKAKAEQIVSSGWSHKVDGRTRAAKLAARAEPQSDNVG